MTTYINQALSEEPINQPMKTITPVLQESLFSWLERIGRFKSSEFDDLQDDKIIEDLDDFLEPEVYALESEED